MQPLLVLLLWFRSLAFHCHPFLLQTWHQTHPLRPRRRVLHRPISHAFPQAPVAALLLQGSRARRSCLSASQGRSRSTRDPRLHLHQKRGTAPQLQLCSAAVDAFDSLDSSSRPYYDNCLCFSFDDIVPPSAAAANQVFTVYAERSQEAFHLAFDQYPSPSFLPLPRPSCHQRGLFLLRPPRQHLS